MWFASLPGSFLKGQVRILFPFSFLLTGMWAQRLELEQPLCTVRSKPRVEDGRATKQEPRFPAAMEPHTSPDCLHLLQQEINTFLA